MIESLIAYIENHVLYRVLVILAVIATIILFISWLLESTPMWLMILFLVITLLVIFAPKFWSSSGGNVKHRTGKQDFQETEQNSCGEHTEQRAIAKITCPICQGSGNKWNAFRELCHFCGGRSYVYTTRDGRPKCKPCIGTGYKNGVFRELCPLCGGIGLLPFEENDNDSQIWSATLEEANRIS